ncbi:MAG: UDP-N-acetylmuramoyl-tripeptide--D-alanyl-D-alanine ligase [Allomuricauda sp.]|nr:MAG: UDP-N-acetylmuramoyl-tripeptide--D-alanyl-D-alanine ligase [Allomuricauda sp.]
MKLTQLHELFLNHPKAFTDTRKIDGTGLFFALKGPSFNGNAFAEQALEKGAAYAIVDEAAYAKDDRFILVDDALETLQQLAVHHRKQCKARVIGLTGSNGKTTTKELIYAVLSATYRTIATQGNLNNHIGVPLTLLTIKKDTEFAIIEMGANHQGEIAFLSSLAQPDYGYITNFGKAHLEGFGGVEGIIKGKSELYNYLTTNDRHVFLNANDPIQLEKLATYIKKFGYSTSNHEYFKITLLGADPFVVLKAEDTVITTQLIGTYNFPNCCAAVLMGKYFSVPLTDIKKAIENYVPENNRSQLIKKGDYHITLDAYNANPTSMEAALQSFDTLDARTKVIFLGDMFELGEEAEKEHQRIADLAMNKQFTMVFLVGENFAKTKTEALQFKSFELLATHLKKHKIQDGHLLIKGSRGMAMERILEYL